MKRLVLFVIAAAALAALVPAAALARGEIYGTVFTDDGERVTGTIRWDKNEAFWDDLIDASKTTRVWDRDRREGLDLRILGIRIHHSGEPSRTRTYAQFSIPFGHVAAIEPGSNRRVRVELKSGESFDVIEGADLGRRVRDIVVDGPAGEVELDWGDLKRVEFAEGPAGAGRSEDRLYGTVETAIGEFTGYVVWDMDEVLGSDELDGEYRGEDVEIRFAEIKSIERDGRRRSRVVLHNGDELELEGSNDVNSENRGIAVMVRDMGMVRMDWGAFRKVTFAAPPPSPAYADYDGGRRLRGTVTTEDGETLTGDVTWDKDESYTWESLGGDIRGVSFEIQFEHIARIEKLSRSAAKVTLNDGIEFTLKDSNDVNHRNKGIVVTLADREERTLGWGEFKAVEFSRP